MKVSSELIYLSGDIQHMTTALVVGVEVQMRQAARAFLSAALAKVPVRTGFAAAPFRNIGEATNIAGYASQLTRRKDFKDTFRKDRRLKRLQEAARNKRDLYLNFIRDERSNAALNQRVDEDFIRTVETWTARLESMIERVKQQRRKLAILRGTLIQNLEAARSSRFKTIKVRRKGQYKKTRLGNTFELLREGMQREGQFIGFQLDPLRNKDKEANLEGVEYYRDGKRLIPKNPTTGRKFGTEPDKIFLRDRQFVFSFNFENTIKYFRVEDEFGKNSPSAPWKAMLAGSQAFIDYWKKYGFKRLPRFVFLPRHFSTDKKRGTGRDDVINLADLLVVSKYIVDGNTLKSETIKPADRSVISEYKRKEQGDNRPKTQGFSYPRPDGGTIENAEAESSFKKASRENRRNSNKENNLRQLKLRAAERRLKKYLKKQEAKAKFEAIMKKKINKQIELFEKLQESLANLKERQSSYSKKKKKDRKEKKANRESIADILAQDPDAEFKFGKKKKSGRTRRNRRDY